MYTVACPAHTRVTRTSASRIHMIRPITARQAVLAAKIKVKRKGAIAGSIALVILVLGVVFLMRPRGPEALARALINAQINGDWKRIWELSDPTDRAGSK